MTTAFVPYCGHSPVPGALTWNTDPILISILCVIGATYALSCRTGDAPATRERCYFGLGLFMTAAAFLSPLCNLSVALFSARVAQHIILTLIAAPLIVLGRPESAIARMLTRRGRARQPPSRVAASGVAFALAMWTWHMPGPYDATLRSNVVYWLMHLTLFGSALVMWHCLLRDQNRAATAVTAVATGIQMGLLGALLTLAPRPLFVVHFSTTWPWGLSPLQDQQLGGVIMWVLAGTLFTAYGLAAFATWLNADDGPTKIASRRFG